MGSDAPFRILCIDGGGVRGIYAAMILMGIENELGICIQDHFDLIAGTSTGSIIAGALASNISMDRVVNLFEQEVPTIFKKRFCLCSLIRSKYDSKALKNVLDKTFGDTRLGNINVPLMIFSSNMTIGMVHVFKSSYLAKFEPYVRDGQVKLSYAVLASCSAPTYFDPVNLYRGENVEPHLLCDGGLWANNPSIFALTEAVSKFGKKLSQVRVLSIGTGFDKVVYPRRPGICSLGGDRLGWGVLTGWGGADLVRNMLSLQSQSSANQAELILRGSYMRVDTGIPLGYALDKVEIIGDMRGRGQESFAREARAIEAFLSE